MKNHKNTLWTFGDSLTDFYYPPSPKFRHWRHEYTEWKGYNTKVYGEIIAQKLNMNLVNKAKGAHCNSFIFEEFCKVSNQIKKDDIVIFGWTNQQRFRLSDKNNNWVYFNTNPTDDSAFFLQGEPSNLKLLSKSTITEILINRIYSVYSIEICNWINLINHTLKDIIVFHWSWSDYDNECDIYHAKGFKTIKDETNGYIDDAHWCEQSHFDFANIILDKITNGKITISKNLL